MAITLTATADPCSHVLRRNDEAIGFVQWHSSEQHPRIVLTQSFAHLDLAELPEVMAAYHAATGRMDPLSELRQNADRWLKLRAAINHLGRVPMKLARFIAVTAGSNAAGMDEAVDAIVDYRKPA